MAVNLTGVFLMCRAAIHQMQRQVIHNEVRGRIVDNISSQHGMVAAPEAAAYGASKAGVVYLTRQVAVDYAKESIVCNAVAPGKILTGKTGRAVEQRWLDYSHARTPLPRLGRSEDVANAAALPGLRRGDLHHRREPDGRRRLDGGLGLRPLLTAEACAMRL